MDKKTLTREELYNLVWSKPMTRIAEMYGLSDNGIRKICIKMNIPLPKSGHWAKVKHGKKVMIAKLPEKYTGKNEVTLNSKEVSELINDQSRYITLIKEINATPNLPLKVPDKLTKPDKLIVEAKAYLKTQKASQYSRNRGIINTDNSHISIQTAPGNIKRALLIMDTLIKLFRKRGHEVTIKNSNTCVIIDDEVVTMKLKEKNKIVKVKSDYSWTSSEYHPTGVLSLIFEIDLWHTQKVISDGVELLESKLHQILAKAEILGELQKKNRLALEASWARQREEARIEKERKDRIEKEKTDLKKFISDADRWQHAQFLRSYLNSLKYNAIEKQSLTPELTSYIQWAEAKINWYDPLINADDPFLTEEYKAELLIKEVKLPKDLSRTYW